MDTKKLIIDFEKNLKRLNKSQNTIQCYISDVKEYLSVVSDLNEESICEYKSFLESKNITNKTLSRKFQSIRCLANFLNAEKKDFIDPTRKINLPKPLRKSINFLTKEEISKINIAARDDSKIFTAINLLLQTGMLISEAMELKVRDINFENYTLSVGKRDIELCDKLFFILKNYIYENHNKFYTNTPLFMTSKKTPMHVRNMRTYISRIFKKAEVNKTINDLRNTFIIHQLKNGHSIEFVRDYVGHASSQTTDRYLRLVPNYKKKHLNRVIEL